MYFNGLFIILIAGFTNVSIQSPSIPLKDKLADTLTFIAYAEQVFPEHGISLKRQSNDLIGAWSLRALSCPEKTVECEDRARATKACCPENTQCVPYIYRIPCCPTKDRCDTTSLTFPKCGNPEWSLWQGGTNEGFFCCLPGQKGALTTNGGGACVDANLELQPSQVATTVTPYTGGSGGGGTKSTSRPSSTGSKVNNETDNPSNPSNSNSGSNSGSNSPNDDEDDKSGLSAGVIGGIAAGAVFILLLFGIGIFWAMKVGMKRGTQATLSAVQQAQGQSQPPGENFDPPQGGTFYTAPPEPQGQYTMVTQNEKYPVAGGIGIQPSQDVLSKEQQLGTPQPQLMQQHGYTGPVYAEADTTAGARQYAEMEANNKSNR